MGAEDSGAHPRDPARETAVIAENESKSSSSSLSSNRPGLQERFVAIEIQSLQESKGGNRDHELERAPEGDLEKNLERDPEGDLEKNLEKDLEGNLEDGGDEKEKEQEARICRVCHLSLHDDREQRDDDPDDPIDSKIASRGALEAIELGCACKDDLAFAHRRCAETWFKIKGNRNCEICGRLAQNVVGCCDDPSLARASDAQSDSIYEQQYRQQGGDQARSFWQHRPICNFVLAFIVVILLLPWLFRIRLF